MPPFEDVDLILQGKVWESLQEFKKQYSTQHFYASALVKTLEADPDEIRKILVNLVIIGKINIHLEQYVAYSMNIDKPYNDERVDKSS